MCDQQSLRSACAYAQSDQSLCLPLDYSLSVKLLTEHHLEFLRLKGGCNGSSESTLVKMPHCMKSHVTAHINNCQLKCHIVILPYSKFEEKLVINNKTIMCFEWLYTTERYKERKKEKEKTEKGFFGSSKNSLIHLFIHSFIHSFIPSSFVRSSFFHLFIHPFNHLYIFSFTLSLND